MFPKLGMYVYMFNAITGTFLSVLRVFVLYIVAFGLTFYVLMQNQVCTFVTLKIELEFCVQICNFYKCIEFHEGCSL